MLAIFTLIIAGAAVLIAYSIAIKGIVKEWDDKIYPGVTVQEVNIGGMTKEEAKNKLTETFVTSIENKKLSIKIEDKQYELIYSDINPKYDIDATVEEAYKLGKKDGVLSRYISIKSNNSKSKEVPIKFSYNEEKLKEYEEKLQIAVNQPAKDAAVSIQKNNIVIKPETEGKTVNLDTLDQKLKENINGDINSDNSVSIDLEVTKLK